MDTMAAFVMGETSKDKIPKVFDWLTAVDIIKQHGFKDAVAGLKEDMEWTSGTIFTDGKPMKNEYTYLSSTWTTPVIEIETDDGVLTIPCWVYETYDTNPNGFNAESSWPECAKKKLEELMKNDKEHK